MEIRRNARLTHITALVPLDCHVVQLERVTAVAAAQQAVCPQEELRDGEVCEVGVFECGSCSDVEGSLEDREEEHEGE